MLKITNFSKTYSRSVKKAVDDVSFTLEKGKTMEQMADELEENMETIAKICSAIEKVGVHDAEAIFRIMNPE